MKPKILLRIAAFLLLFHVVGHSFGMANRKNTNFESAQAVIRHMSEVNVPLMGKETNRTFDDFYFGMGISLSFALFTFGVLLWMLGNSGETAPKLTKLLLYPVLFCLLSFTVIDFTYFFPVPAFTCLLASIAIVLAQYRLAKA